MTTPTLSERIAAYLDGRVPVCGAAIALIRDAAALESERDALRAELKEAHKFSDDDTAEPLPFNDEFRRRYPDALMELTGRYSKAACADAIVKWMLKYDAAEAEVARLREALHPGPMPTYSDGVTMCCERQHETGLWVCGPFAELPTRLWCNNANRYEALTGLDAMTGEKR